MLLSRRFSAAAVNFRPVRTDVLVMPDVPLRPPETAIAEIICSPRAARGQQRLARMATKYFNMNRRQ